MRQGFFIMVEFMKKVRRLGGEMVFELFIVLLNIICLNVEFIKKFM